MDNALKGISFRRDKSYPLLYFSCFWCFGFLLGCVTGLSAEPSFFPLMRWTFSGSMSIVGLLSILCLPYLLTAFAVIYRIPRFLFIVSFLKAFLLGFTCALLKICFGEVHWVFMSLVLFTDFFSLLILMVLWLRAIQGCCLVSQIITGLCLSLGIGVFDFVFISPFAAAMIEKW